MDTEKLKQLLSKSSQALKERQKPILLLQETKETIKLDTTAKEYKSKPEKVKGEIKKENNWFEMIPAVMTQETKLDLHIIQNRHVLDPKRHYKRNVIKPKIFQVYFYNKGWLY